MKKRYDLIFCIGTACSCSQTLRGAGLQLMSFPFDWVSFHDEAEDVRDAVVTRIECICNGFDGWIRREDFHTIGENGGDHMGTGTLDCYNDRLQMRFPHDFPTTKSLDESFPSILEKYRRRISRLYELLDQSDRILLFRMERPNQSFEPPVESFAAARERLLARYPGKHFDFLAFRQRPGVPYRKRTVERVGDWLTIVSFDYKSYAPDVPPYEADIRHTVAALRKLVSVRDYRTPEERKAKKLKDRQKKYGKYGATNWLQYHVARLHEKIARHFS